jgi:hypothetical protein
MSQLIRAVYRILELIRITNKQASGKQQEVSGLSRLTKATLHMSPICTAKFGVVT